MMGPDLKTLEGNIAQMWLYANSNIFEGDNETYASGVVRFDFTTYKGSEHVRDRVVCEILFEEDRRRVAVVDCDSAYTYDAWTVEWLYNSSELRKEALLAAQRFNVHAAKLDAKKKKEREDAEASFRTRWGVK